MKKLSIIFFSSIFALTLAACIVSQNDIPETNGYESMMLT